MITLKIRQTHARVFKQCDMKYNLMVNHRLVSKNKSIALSIGSAVHAGRAEWLKTWDVSKALLKTHYVLEAEVKNFPALAVSHDAKEKKPCLDCAKRITQEMIAHYCATFWERFPKGSINVIAIEMPFSYTLAQYEELELILEGTFDAAIMYGPYFLNFELKTTAKQLPLFFDQEIVSRQHRSYPMAMQGLFPDKHVYGTMLDAIRKPGKTFGPECNHELIPVDEGEIAELRRDYVEQLQRIARAMKDDYWPQNWDNCHTIRGRCEYFDICKSKFNPHVIREKYNVVDDLRHLIDDEDETANGA